MTLLTLAEAKMFQMTKSSGTLQIVLEAGKSYVLPMAQVNRFLADKDMASLVYKLSRIENRIQNFHVGAKKTGSQRLLLFNGSGGYGDQILTWPIGKILADMGYDVHILADPGNQMCWWNFPWVKSISNVPMLYEQFKMYDYHVMWETVVNGEEHQDQCHPVDQMLRKIGINPDQVDNASKVVQPIFTYRENWLADQIKGNDKIAIYQLSAANVIRSLSPSDSAYMLVQLAQAFPEWKWYAAYDEFIPKAYPDMLQCRSCGGTGKTAWTSGTLAQQAAFSGTLPEAAAQVYGTGNVPNVPQGTLPAQTDSGMVVCQACNGQKTLVKNIQMLGNLGLRELWALTSKAQVVVCPDSMMVHVAGSMSVPCVGLWGLSDPANRARYYKNHLPVFKRQHCYASPCYGYSLTFPRLCQPKQNRISCDVLAAINPQDVIEKVEQIEAARAQMEKQAVA